MNLDFWKKNYTKKLLGTWKSMNENQPAKEEKIPSTITCQNLITIGKQCCPL
jgi:hypothetical protein